jgi:TrkA domain protein
VIASPTPAQQLRSGDILVVVGTDDGIATVREILARRPH